MAVAPAEVIEFIPQEERLEGGILDFIAEATAPYINPDGLVKPPAKGQMVHIRATLEESATSNNYNTLEPIVDILATSERTSILLRDQDGGVLEAWTHDPHLATPTSPTTPKMIYHVNGDASSPLEDKAALAKAEQVFGREIR